MDDLIPRITASPAASNHAGLWHERRLDMKLPVCAVHRPVGQWSMSKLFIWLMSSIGLTFFLAGIVNGMTGMGPPTMATGVLGAIIAPVAAAALLIVPSLIVRTMVLSSFWSCFA
ncbi:MULTISPECIES: hypothetical protein [Microvirga]|uniref:hypothetical protein n=1 Tax=Microvirga TaxID=186650 RepID=UPI001B381553|nr:MULTISPECIES: hypothetical protein [unclassified Microvirga]MBQ0819254.1 hypothetical protein [Microvirga sp. HBU67558]